MGNINIKEAINDILGCVEATEELQELLNEENYSEFVKKVIGIPGIDYNAVIMFLKLNDIEITTEMMKSEIDSNKVIILHPNRLKGYSLLVRSMMAHAPNFIYPDSNSKIPGAWITGAWEKGKFTVDAILDYPEIFENSDVWMGEPIQLYCPRFVDNVNSSGMDFFRVVNINRTIENAWDRCELMLEQLQ